MAGNSEAALQLCSAMEGLWASRGMRHEAIAAMAAISAATPARGRAHRRPLDYPLGSSPPVHVDWKLYRGAVARSK